jgi:hypothetical protein
MTFSQITQILEALSYLTVIIGLPTAVIQYRHKTQKEQADREYGTYNALDEKYLEYLRLCYESPGLDVFDVADTSPSVPNEQDAKRELIAFTILFSIFERAFLMYHEQSDEIRQRQWTGWFDYIQQFCRRENFQRAWRISGATFDLDFQHFMVTQLGCSVPELRPASSSA